jgi:hypothetical protein
VSKVTCDSPEPESPVLVIVTVAGPTTGRAGLMLKSPATFSPLPVFTHIALSVNPLATLMTYWFSDAETTVMPGAGAPSQPPVVSYFPSSTGHCADAGAAATPTITSSSTPSAKKRLNSLSLSLSLSTAERPQVAAGRRTFKQSRTLLGDFQGTTSTSLNRGMTVARAHFPRLRETLLRRLAQRRE